MAKTPIRDIIEILSQHAEECMDLLGSVVPMFLTTDKEDNVHYFFIPPGISKTRAIKAMKELVEETEAVQCVFVDEAWMLERSCDVSREQIEEEASKPLENNPDSIDNKRLVEAGVGVGKFVRFKHHHPQWGNLSAYRLFLP